MTHNIETQIVQLISFDRADTAFSSFHQKMARRKKSIAEAVSNEIERAYHDCRVFADVVTEENQKARGYVEGAKEFALRYPKYGKILNGLIEQTRVAKDTYLEFGLQNGSKLTMNDYLAVMQDIGLTEQQARGLYPGIFAIGKKLQKSRDETRSILLS